MKDIPFVMVLFGTFVAILLSAYFSWQEWPGISGMPYFSGALELLIVLSPFILWFGFCAIYDVVVDKVNGVSV